MNGCILGNQYLPSAAYFAHWMHHGEVLLEEHEHYQKRSWRNKTAILGPQKPLFLTVPLEKGKHQQLPIREVRIAYHGPWAKLHLNSIQAAYGKTAFYQEVQPGLEKILLSGFETLWELNINLLGYITELIPGTWAFQCSERYERHYPDSVMDLRPGVPAVEQIHVAEDSTHYHQVQRLGGTHQPNLSILDVLCHLGPETAHYLHRYADKLYPST